MTLSWNTEEKDRAAELARDIDRCAGPRTTAASSPEVSLTELRASSLRETLSCAPEGLIVCQLCREMGFDNSRVFALRFEHKLTQALVIHHYCPETLPVTVGLSRWLRESHGESSDSAFERLAVSNLIVKRTLGYASGEKGAANLSKSRVLQTEAFLCKPFDGLSAERFIVQELIEIDREYRVHSLEDCVIPQLTVDRFEQRQFPDARERDAVNAFVQSTLDRLPSVLVHGCLYAWDVARTRGGDLKTIEVNVTGTHPVFEPGFHCSGFFLGRSWGPLFTAKLLQHVEMKYGVRIRIDPAAIQNFYWWAARWKRLLNISRDICELKGEVLCSSAYVCGSTSTSAVPGQSDKFYQALFGLNRIARVLENLSSQELDEHDVVQYPTNA